MHGGMPLAIVLAISELVCKLDSQLRIVAIMHMPMANYANYL